MSIDVIGTLRCLKELVTPREDTKMLPANFIDTILRHHYAAYTKHATIFRFMCH